MHKKTGASARDKIIDFIGFLIFLPPSNCAGVSKVCDDCVVEVEMCVGADLIELVVLVWWCWRCVRSGR